MLSPQLRPGFINAGLTLHVRTWARTAHLPWVILWPSPSFWGTRLCRSSEVEGLSMTTIWKPCWFQGVPTTLDVFAPCTNSVVQCLVHFILFGALMMCVLNVGNCAACCFLGVLDARKVSLFFGIARRFTHGAGSLLEFYYTYIYIHTYIYTYTYIYNYTIITYHISHITPHNTCNTSNPIFIWLYLCCDIPWLPSIPLETSQAWLPMKAMQETMLGSGR